MSIEIRPVPTFTELYQRGRGDIVRFADDFLQLPCPIEHLHPGQERWLHSHPFCPERMLACGNRWGKSISSAVKLLHNAFYQMRLPQYAELSHTYTAISLSVTLDMACIVWDWLVAVAQSSPLLKRFIVDVKKRDPFPVLTLGEAGSSAWRSEICARSTAYRGVYLLGRSFDLVCWDEAARDPQGLFILDDVLRMRMVDRQGRIDMTSTGAGKNWYYKQCLLGAKDSQHRKYYFQTGSVYENPSIDRGRIEDAKERMTREMVKQNIYGEFVDFASLFSMADVEACYLGQDYHLLTTPEEAQKEMHTFPREARFVMGVDFGRKRDETVILVARSDLQTARIVYAQAIGFGAHWDDIYAIVAKVHHTFNDAFCVADATAHGGDISTDILMGERYNVRHMLPYNSAGPNAKTHLLTVGQLAIQKQTIVWPYIGPLYDQLLMYNYDDRNICSDWVMAFCLLAEGVRRATQSHAIILPAQFLVFAHQDHFDGFDHRRQEVSFTTALPAAMPLPDHFQSSTHA